MTSNISTTDFLAVAFVVESSLAIAEEWRRIFVDYVSHMLKRLGDTNPGYATYMAFVVYGPADNAPSPLLCKRFFADHAQVMEELRSNPAKLGIGQANANSQVGMAALEGFVAAIELFDILRDSTHPLRSHVSHIFHIAAFPPDEAIHPQWNDSPPLDSVTWNGLPLELKKRNIHLSTISLRTNLLQFAQLHSALTSGAPKEPWFPIRPLHSVLLAGFSAAPAKAVKRPAEPLNINDKTPESKRPKLVQHASPTPSVPMNQLKPSPPTANSSNMQPPMPLPTAQQYQALLINARTLEEQLKRMQAVIETNRKAGDPGMVEPLKTQFAEKVMHLRKVKFYLSKIYEQMIARRNASSSQSGTASTSALSSISGDNQATVTRPMANLQHSSSHPARPPVNPAVAAQMHKLIEQQQKNRSTSQGHPIPTMFQNSSAETSPAAPSPIRQQPPQQAGLSSQTGQGRQKGPMAVVWTGSFAWSGLDASGKKDMGAYVVASCNSAENSRADTWPRTLTLVPTREPAAPRSVLQQWLGRTNPVICTFQAQTQGIPDPKSNETNFMNFVQMLQTKNIYATAAWTRPSGDQGANVLIIALSTEKLVGAFFPLTGVPDYPKSTPMPGAGLVARMNAMTPAQREMFMAQLQRQKERVQQAVLNASVAGGVGPGLANTNNSMAMDNGMNMIPNQQQTSVLGSPFNPASRVPMVAQSSYSQIMAPDMMSGIGMGQMGGMLGGGMVRGNGVMRDTGSGVGGANVSYEMLQSFMQRGADNTSS